MISFTTKRPRKAAGRSFSTLPRAVRSLREEGFQPLDGDPCTWKKVSQREVITATVHFTDVDRRVLVVLS
jgi:hypothetical protein